MYRVKTLLSHLTWLVLTMLMVTKVQASCPDPNEIHVQQGTDIEQRRLVTNSGWVSDFVFDINTLGITLTKVSIAQLQNPKDRQSYFYFVRCEYTSGSYGFNMREPFQFSMDIYKAEITNPEEWDQNSSGPGVYHYCAVAGDRKCEFEFKPEL